MVIIYGSVINHNASQSNTCTQIFNSLAKKNSFNHDYIIIIIDQRSCFLFSWESTSCGFSITRFPLTWTSQILQQSHDEKNQQS